MYRYLNLLCLLAFVAVTPAIHAEEKESITDKILSLFDKDENKPAAAPAEKKDEDKKEDDKKEDDKKAEATPAEAEKKAETPAEAPASTPQKADLSSITDPKIKSCAQNYEAEIAKCGADENCKLDARHNLKGCVRPEVARKYMYGHSGLFGQADEAFRSGQFYRECSDTFSRLRTECNGNKGCEEVLYYSLHNNCGKRLFHKGYVQDRSSTYETLVVKKTAEAQQPAATKTEETKPAAAAEAAPQTETKTETPAATEEAKATDETKAAETQKPAAPEAAKTEDAAPAAEGA